MREQPLPERIPNPDQHPEGNAERERRIKELQDAVASIDYLLSGKGEFLREPNKELVVKTMINDPDFAGEIGTNAGAMIALAHPELSIRAMAVYLQRKREKWGGRLMELIDLREEERASLERKHDALISQAEEANRRLADFEQETLAG